MTDSLSLIKLLETSRFDQDCFLFTIDFKSLYTNIPVEHAIKCIKELVEEYKHVISSANFIVELLEIVLHNSLITFDGEYFQQFFGFIMGTNIAPILAYIYMARLETILKEKCKMDNKLKWQCLFKRFIDDGFGIIDGNKLDFEYCVSEFNLLYDSI